MASIILFILDYYNHPISQSTAKTTLEIRACRAGLRWGVGGMGGVGKGGWSLVGFCNDFFTGVICV